MDPLDPRHGTTRGFSAGCREDCCRIIRNLDEARRRKYRQVLGITRSVSAVGTQRRIRALMAIGWTSRDIAARCGWTTTQAVTELLTDRKYVYSGTHDRIVAAYNGLSMTVGPSDKNRRDARRKGWAPPLAWDDDIDDPAAKPRGVGRDKHRQSDFDPAMVDRVLSGDTKPRKLTNAEAAEVVRRALAAGRSTTAIERLYGLKVERYQKVEVA